MRYSEYIQEDYIACNRSDKKMCLNKLVNREHENILWKYQKLLRKEEWYARKGNIILSVLYRRKKNRLGERLGLTIPKNVFQGGLHIWHYGNIVVNANAKVGRNCILHGNNCIGNKGNSIKGESPVIGDNVDIGFGAIIIGNIKIANNIRIAAGAVVVNSCLEDGVVLAGVPARVIH